MTPNQIKLRNLLAELFQLDQADLDFGIYRIMNSKRDEILRFLDKDLIPQVQAALAVYQSAGTTALQQELDKVIEQAKQLGVDPESTDKVKDLRKRMSQAVDVLALENSVFSHLFNFFRRYYSEGDFISLRRYKEGVYAIPYEGEEVKLHWANADQYYVKSSESFRDYCFTLPPLAPGGRGAGGEGDKRRVRFHLVAATTEQDNNKAAAGKDRRFIVADPPLAEENGELLLRFTYRVHEGKEKQEELNRQAAEAIFAATGFDSWLTELRQLAKTDKQPERTVLEKHLEAYTKKNTFDYFIHKNLAKFLKRELDFYIKNEVMHLDDIEGEQAPKVEQYLSQIKVLRSIAHKIIAFLGQLEDFQKKLWLKKKFVLETNYCITLDRVPEELYAEIAANEAQREEWVKLFAIDEIKGDLNDPGYSVPLTVGFLKSQLLLPLSTRHFDRAFITRLLHKIEQLSLLSGVLLHSENSNALHIISPLLQGSVRFIYIDPPFNTDDDGFIYKDSYQHSSWASLIHNRLVAAYSLLTSDGTIAVSIGQEEVALLRKLMDSVFGYDNLISLITIKRGSVTGHKAINPGVVNISEYVLVYAKDRRVWSGNSVYSQRDRDTRYSTYITNLTSPVSEWKFISLLDAVAMHHGIARDKLKDSLGSELDAVINQFVTDHGDAVVRLADVNIGGVGEDFRQAISQSQQTADKVCLHRRDGYPDVFLLNGQRLLFYKHKLVKIGDRLETAEKASDIWLDVLPNDLHNEGGVSLKKGKKPEALISRLVALGSDEGDIVLDFFCGTGTAAAVAEKMSRKWLAVESANYFWDKTVVRMLNVIRGETRGVSKSFNWKGGGAFSHLI